MAVSVLGRESTTGEVQTTVVPVYFEDTLTTTDATLTTISTIALSVDSAVLVEAFVVGKQPSGSETAGYVLRALFYRVGAGGAALQGTINTDFVRETTNSMDATFEISGNNILIRVKGIASTTINWKASYKIAQV